MNAANGAVKSTEFKRQKKNKKTNEKLQPRRMKKS